MFSSFAGSRLFDEIDPDVRYAGARAHNRGMAEFVADDDRLLGVAALPLDDPERAEAELDASLEPTDSGWPGSAPRPPVVAPPATRPTIGSGPSWPRPEVPFVLHVGSGKLCHSLTSG